MNWEQLLSAKRRGESSSLPLAETRSRFEQDFDRIIFSHPFRKLQDKTQVFPMPEDDFVHTRLTHSLEVSSVGRSLGKEVGVYILSQNPDLQKMGLTYNELGAITAAASLAHDLGNPPFGHAGEAAISSFFKFNMNGKFFEPLVTKAEWADITNFEGNAQGFRILNSPLYGGLKLTYATLAAFTKYPLSSSSAKTKDRKSQKKYGFTQSDAKSFEAIASETGLVAFGEQTWSRHPLAFLVEAADDICYSIIDLEDGTRLGLVPFETTQTLLAAIIGEDFSSEKLQKLPDLNEKLGALRAMAINQLVGQCVAVFIQNHEAIMNGEFDAALTERIDSTEVLKSISELSVIKIYRSKQVMNREASGYEIIDQLMEKFTVATYQFLFGDAQKSARHTSLIRLLPDSYQNILKTQKLTVYQTLQVVTDFVSGLTDSSAFRMHQTISGNRFY